MSPKGKLKNDMCARMTIISSLPFPFMAEFFRAPRIDVVMNQFREKFGLIDSYSPNGLTYVPMEDAFYKQHHFLLANQYFFWGGEKRLVWSCTKMPSWSWKKSYGISKNKLDEICQGTVEKPVEPFDENLLLRKN